ncbi:hypothetical protein BS78_10G153500 [Paspalum vaginatum]|nr:hypothetical protein BS78_10G153500 [Paspalum vaginatum]
MASSRTATVAMALFLVVCLILSSTLEAARMVGQRGEVAVAGVNGGGGRGNVRYLEQPQQQGFIGRRPRLVSFTRRGGVALPNGQDAGEDGGYKREVPSGPDPKHHGSTPASDAGSTTP